MAEIVEIDIVKVAVDVPERDIAFFSVGQKVEVLVDIKGRQPRLTGTITFISSWRTSGPAPRAWRSRLPTRTVCLRSGQIVQVRLTRQILENAILIPLLAVIPMENG